jgi:hypothetical protein
MLLFLKKKLLNQFKVIMKKIEIYTKNYYSFCVKAKLFLHKKKIIINLCLCTELLI